jgi:hypothetical protein
MLDAIKRLLGMETIPHEAEIIYLEAKDEEDAKRLFRAEKGRMVRHRDRIIEDIGVLETEEARFMEQGRSTSSPIRREVLARQVAEVREKAASFLNRVDLLTSKIAIFERHLDLLRDRGVLTGPMPDPDMLERTAGDVQVARRELEGMIDLSEATEGVSRLTTGGTAQDEVLDEMEGKADLKKEMSFDEMVEQQERRRRPQEEKSRREAPLEE